MTTMRIGAVATRIGLSADTLRYYERIGVIPPIGRDASGHRAFTETDIAWAEYATCLRSLGMAVDDIAAYVDAATDPSKRDVQMGLLREHVERLRRQRDVIDGFLRTAEAKLLEFGR